MVGTIPCESSSTRYFSLSFLGGCGSPHDAGGPRRRRHFPPVWSGHADRTRKYAAAPVELQPCTEGPSLLPRVHFCAQHVNCPKQKPGKPLPRHISGPSQSSRNRACHSKPTKGRLQHKLHKTCSEGASCESNDLHTDQQTSTKGRKPIDFPKAPTNKMEGICLTTCQNSNGISNGHSSRRLQHVPASAILQEHKVEKNSSSSKPKP